MDDENYEKRKEQCEHGIHWLESSSVCKTIVRQKYGADDLSTKVNATRKALKNDVKKRPIIWSQSIESCG